MESVYAQILETLIAVGLFLDLLATVRPQPPIIAKLVTNHAYIEH